MYINREVHAHIYIYVQYVPNVHEYEMPKNESEWLPSIFESGFLRIRNNIHAKDRNTFEEKEKKMKNGTKGNE